MDKDKIIDGLRMTMDLFTFDPTTGEEKDPDDLNDLDRATYDACKGALEILERLDTDSDTISRQAAIDICRAPHMRNADCSDFEMAIMMLPPAQLNVHDLAKDADCISRRAAITALSNEIVKRRLLDEMYDGCIDEFQTEEILKKLPPAQPERIRGRWISADTIFGGVPFYCSECGENTRDTVMGKPRWNFCPNCGAEMEVTT